MNSGIQIILQFAMPVIQFGVILFAAKLCGRGVQFIKLPRYVGELIAGILLSPYMLGSFCLPGWDSGIFPIVKNTMFPVHVFWYAFAAFSAAMIAFLYGTRTNIKVFSISALPGFLVSICGMIPAFLFGAALSMLMLNTGFLDPRCLFLGLICSVSGISLSAKILSQKKCTNLQSEKTILSVGMTEPLIGMLLLLAILLAAGPLGNSFIWGSNLIITVKSLFIWGAAACLGWFLSYKYTFFIGLFRSHSVFALFFLGLILLPIGCFEQAGFIMILGAFITGLAFSRLPAAITVQNELHIFFDLMSSLFFVIAGMFVDVRVFADKRILLFALLYTALAILAKLVGASLAALCTRRTFMTSVRIGAGLIPRGAFTLLLAFVGTASIMVYKNKMIPVIDTKLFGVTVFMVLFTTIITIPLLSLLSKRFHADRDLSEQIQTVYEFPTEELAAFMYKKLLGNFLAEGYFHYEMELDSSLTYFHRGDHVFSLKIERATFIFDSLPQEVIVIKTVVYEAIIDLYRSIGILRKAAIPGAMEPAADFSDMENAEDSLLEKIIPPGCITTDLQAESQEEAIVELVQLLGDNGHLVDTRECIFDALARESIMSTCTAERVAFPHARTSGTRKMTAAIGISRKGYKEFKTSGQDIQVVLLCICPPEDDQTYLQFVASVSAKLNDPEYFRQLLEAEDVAAIRVLFSGHK